MLINKYLCFMRTMLRVDQVDYVRCSLSKARVSPTYQATLGFIGPLYFIYVQGITN